MVAMESENPTAPSADEMERIVHAVIDGLPGPFAAAAREVALRIEEVAPDSFLADMGIEDAYDLTGLYDGIPMPHKSVSDQPLSADTIWLFRRAILDEWVARGDIGLADLVAHVFIHELAHHFGWSDAEIAAIDPWWE